ncbi:MAG: hypothetical protein M3390_10945 [Chloroflexota bacterium]|nr:hypothetical protein [Chloroflexota bacterium]
MKRLVAVFWVWLYPCGVGNVLIEFPLPVHPPRSGPDVLTSFEAGLLFNGVMVMALLCMVAVLLALLVRTLIGRKQRPVLEPHECS